jgi:hypothetical protein
VAIRDWFRKREQPTVVPTETVVRRVVVPKPSSAAPPGYVSPYLPGPLAVELLVLGADGLPPLYFTMHEGAWWLAEVSTDKLVNVGTRQLRRLGIWSCRVRGDAYADGRLRVGPVDLMREPSNPHDPNAVAIHQDGEHVGYFNRGMAPGLAKVLDHGGELLAVGVSADPPKVVAASPEVMRHLTRRMR